MSKYVKLSEEEKEFRKQQRKTEKELKKDIEKMEAEKNQRPVRKITITIEWNKNHNPHATAEVRFYPDDKFSCIYEQNDKYTASGWGYDKESTVIAAIFNDYLKYKLWQKTSEQLLGKDYKWREENGAPYGINNWTRGNGTETRCYSGGIGTNCYFDISEYIGGKFQNIANGKTFSVYVYTDNK